MSPSTDATTDAARADAGGAREVVRQYRRCAHRAGWSWRWVVLLVLLGGRGLATPPGRREISSDLYVMF